MLHVKRSLDPLAEVEISTAAVKVLYNTKNDERDKLKITSPAWKHFHKTSNKSARQTWFPFFKKANSKLRSIRNNTKEPFGETKPQA